MEITSRTQVSLRAQVIFTIVPRRSRTWIRASGAPRERDNTSSSVVGVKLYACGNPDRSCCGAARTGGNISRRTYCSDVALGVSQWQTRSGCPHMRNWHHSDARSGRAIANKHALSSSASTSYATFWLRINSRPNGRSTRRSDNFTRT